MMSHYLLLLLTLTSCVCEPTFVVKVTQSSYQAEENHHVTLEWTFNYTQGSTEPNNVFCQMFTDDHKEPKILYHLREGVEDINIQDKQFSGRVQCDRDVLREGRVRLDVSRLRTEDSGRYQCRVVSELGSGSDECRLKVTAAEGPGPRPEGEEPPSWGMIAAYVALAAAGLVVIGRLSYFVYRHRVLKRERREARLAARPQMV